MSKIRYAAAVCAISLALGGCGMFGSKEAAPVSPSPEKPVQQSAAPRGPEFDCGTAGKLEVVFNTGNERSVTAYLNGGAGKVLKMGDDGQTWREGPASLSMQGDQAVYADGATKRTCKFVSRSVPAPTVAGVVRTVTIADKGKTIEFKKGEKISVALVGVPTAGYVWGADSSPSFVKVSDGPGGSTSTSQWLPGFAGGNHWETVIVEATGTGEGELVLAQRRPWENKADKDAETFKVRLKVS